MTLPTQQPSVSWTELLKTARDFFNAEPWKKIRHESLFGIDNPRAGEVLYCTAIGGSGDVYGMSIYPGAKGLYTYLLTQQQRLQESIPFYYMDCFRLSGDAPRSRGTLCHQSGHAGNVGCSAQLGRVPEGFRPSFKPDPHHRFR